MNTKDVTTLNDALAPLIEEYGRENVILFAKAYGRKSKAELQEGARQEIVQLKKSGLSASQIGTLVGRSKERVYQILNQEERRAWCKANRKTPYAPNAIETLDLSVRVFNALKRAGYKTIDDVLPVARGEKMDDNEKFAPLRNFGFVALLELQTKLREKGYGE